MFNTARQDATARDIHFIAKSIGTPSNERFEYFSNFNEYKS